MQLPRPYMKVCRKDLICRWYCWIWWGKKETSHCSWLNHWSLLSLRIGLTANSSDKAVRSFKISDTIKSSVLFPFSLILSNCYHAPAKKIAQMWECLLNFELLNLVQGCCTPLWQLLIWPFLRISFCAEGVVSCIHLSSQQKEHGIIWSIEWLLNEREHQCVQFNIHEM